MEAEKFWNVPFVKTANAAKYCISFAAVGESVVFIVEGFVDIFVGSFPRNKKIEKIDNKRTNITIKITGFFMGI